MASETLHYETARHAQSLFNNDPKNLKLLEDELAVKATSREGWIKLEGEEADIERAKQVFQFLEGTLKSGAPVRNREFAYALNVARHDGGGSITDIERRANPDFDAKSFCHSKDRRAEEVSRDDPRP